MADGDMTSTVSLVIPGTTGETQLIQTWLIQILDLTARFTKPWLHGLVAGYLALSNQIP